MRYSFRPVDFQCDACGHLGRDYRWTHEPLGACPSCGSPLSAAPVTHPQRAAAVHGDEIDVTIQHGLCHDDGTPRRFRSRTEMRAVALEKGWRNTGAVNGPI